MQQIIQDMRKRCRMAMNGVVSGSMRERGVTYKLNFGLILQQIKDIAIRYEQNAELAEALWKENTRELKILATHLYPKDAFNAEAANRWMNQIANQEIREQVCLNLFQNLPFADQLGIEWSNSNEEDSRTTGYWLLARLLLSKKITNGLTIEYFDKVWSDVASENIFLRNASLLVLKHIGRNSEEEANLILAKLNSYKDNLDPLKKEAYNSISFEFEFFFGS